MENTIFEKHLGKGSEVEIDGEKYKLKPLGTGDLPDFFKAMKAFSGVDKDGKAEDMMKNLTDESINALQNMVEKTIKKSFPEEWKKNEEQVKEFGLKYMMVLLPKIMEINSADAKTIESKKKEKVFEKLNQSQKK